MKWRAVYSKLTCVYMKKNAYRSNNPSASFWCIISAIAPF